MKVKYKFQVIGRARIGQSFPLRVNGAECAVETDKDGVIKFITLAYTTTDKALWPSITKDPEQGIAATIAMHSPCIDQARETIRVAEGILSFFGVQRIDWGNPEESYLPESDEERGALTVHSMKRSKQEPSPLDFPPISFDIIARPLLRAHKLTACEIPLAFFRRGKNDLGEERHIEACVAFLFMLETLFADGKFKSSQVVVKYTTNKELLDAICVSLKATELAQAAKHKGAPYLDALSSKYLEKSPSEIAESFVDLRGTLHHHTLKKVSHWHPDQHDAFFVDALFLSQVCYRVGFSLVSNEIFSKDAEQEYFHNYDAFKNNATHT